MSVDLKTRELFILALRWRKRYDDCCPDVGMGPSLMTLAQELADSLLHTTLTDEDLKEILGA